ncbi:MAG: DUF2459 domain-containing protein [Gammaproteobacteria bacterium]
MFALSRWIFLLLATSLFQAALPRLAGGAQEAPGTERTIYVLSHGWHTGIVLRYADIPAHLWPEKADFAGRTYLEVGWGDEAFYRAPKVTLGMALRAALTPTQSVLHVVGFDRPLSKNFLGSDIVALRVSARGIADLVRFIHASLARPHGERAQPLGPGLYGESWFYPAEGRYSLIYNCNHWVADGLRRAGVAMDVSTAMTSGNVIRQAGRVGESLR